SCKRSKHSGQKGHIPGRDCMKSAICGTPAANAASIPAKRGVLQPRLHKISVLRHSSCKRGKHSGQKGRFSGRDCTKTPFCSTPAANAASIPAKRGICPAAIAQNQRSAPL
ncbi:MAG: hypothetical protein J5917_08030, partial [Bacteroidales bacterium]|nr:hypothetical protein [Bacteroidales bacterium]